MNKEAMSILKLSGITSAIFVIISLAMGTWSSDIHVHDTYIVMDAATKLILFLLFSVFAGSLIGSVISKFRNKLYNRSLIFSVLLLLSSGIYIFSLFAK